MLLVLSWGWRTGGRQGQWASNGINEMYRARVVNTLIETFLVQRECVSTQGLNLEMLLKIEINNWAQDNNEN